MLLQNCGILKIFYLCHFLAEAPVIFAEKKTMKEQIRQQIETARQGLIKQWRLSRMIDFKKFREHVYDLAKRKFGEIPKDVEHRLIAETDAIKEYGRGEMLLTMWRLVDELRKHDIDIRLTLGQGYNVSLVCYLLGISSFNPIDHPKLKTESYVISTFKLSSEIVFKIDKDQSAVIDGFLNSLRYEVARMDVSGDFHSRKIKACCEGNSDFALEFKYEPNVGRIRIFGELIGWDKFEKIPTDDLETMNLINDIDIYGAMTSSLAPITIEAIREINPSNVEKLADALSFTSERKYSHLLKYLENRDTGNRVFTGHPQIDGILSPTHGILLDTSQLGQIFKLPLRSELGENAYNAIRGNLRSLMASPIVDICDIYVKAYDLYRSAYVKVHYPEIFKKVIESNSNLLSVSMHFLMDIERSL